MKDIVPYDFGARLQEMRKRANFSQKEIAAVIGKHVNTVAKYESNITDPPTKIFQKMMLKYNASANYVLGIDDKASLTLNELTQEEQETILKVYNQFKSNKK